jgi:hypothetical protein
MARYFIFSNSNQLDYIADTEEKKNNFISGQQTYTALEVTESQYNDIKLGKKTAELVNGIVSFIDFGDFETIKNSDDLEQVKSRIKKFIESEIKNLQIKCVSNLEIEHALLSLNVDSLSSIPDQTIPYWVFSQITIPFKRHFEL